MKGLGFYGFALSALCLYSILLGKGGVSLESVLVSHVVIATLITSIWLLVNALYRLLNKPEKTEAERKAEEG